MPKIDIQKIRQKGNIMQSISLAIQEKSKIMPEKKNDINKIITDNTIKKEIKQNPIFGGFRMIKEIPSENTGNSNNMVVHTDKIKQEIPVLNGTKNQESLSPGDATNNSSKKQQEKPLTTEGSEIIEVNTSSSEGVERNIQKMDIFTQILVSDDDFYDAEKQLRHASDIFESCQAGIGKNYFELFENHQNFVKAGIGADSIRGLVLRFSANDLCDVNHEDFTLFLKRIFNKLTEKENILSCAGYRTSNTTECQVLIYPLNGRQLNVINWVDARSKQLKTKIKNKIIEEVAGNFGLNLSESMDIINLGHTPFLDNFPKVKTTQGDRQELFYDTVRGDDQIQTDMPRDKIEEITKIIIKDFTIGIHQAAYLKLNNGSYTPDEYLEEASSQMKRDYPDMTKRDRKFVLGRLRSAALGFYVLDDLINDKKISDIKITSPSRIRVKVQGQRRTSNLRFIDTDDYYRFLQGILARYQRDPDQQIHVFTDKFIHPDYILRNNITLDDINSDFPTYHIRKVPKEKYTIDELIALGVMDRTVANFLIWAARNAKGLVFTGKGSSGKTTMMNTLLEETPSNASGLVIQESEELFTLTKPEMTFEHITYDYDLKALAKNGLLTDIDYFIIGEVKGEEAMYFINACDTGNKGWCSVHSPSSTEAINKLADYVTYASKYNQEQAKYMLKELEVVVFMKNFKVAEISMVDGWDYEKKDLKYNVIFHRSDLCDS